MSRWSLRLKLTLGYALVFAVSIVLGAVGVYVVSSASLTASLDQTLRETAAVAQASIETQNGQSSFSPELKATGDLTIELLSSRGKRLASIGADEDIKEDKAKPPPLQLGAMGFDNNRVFTQRLAGGQYLRISRPSDTLTELLTDLARILLYGSILMIAVACLVGYVLADRALKPVDAVARTAAAIAGRGNYRERVPAMSGHDEMARLTNTVNAMLDQLEHTIEHEKQFARIAAHELRTPLTVLKGRLELTLERPRDAAAYQKALSSMQGRVDALIALSESLLALSRTDAPARLEPVDLAAAVTLASEQFGEIARTSDKRIELSLTESWVSAEAEGVQRVISNLLENALKYSSGETVKLSVKSQVLTVSSAGAGPERDQWTRLLQPFERGSGVQGISGSGLGLALVAALTRRWNAELVPQWSPARFDVEVQFQAARPPTGQATLVLHTQPTAHSTKGQMPL
ncbi:sensor histidine kinase [Deinococcus detaillensis]|uniref:sensor histidine kinase n=1 Tax=Deinococcus detaillensis TaxID=2592048 RepID=UPI001CDB85E2|nr:HAMP domain-containing sensor histidine kinase [Deinococcus detaillensis]